MTTRQRLAADRMIAAKGQTVTLTRQASGAYSPATGTSTVSTSTQTGKGVILPFGPGLRKQDGSTITGDDRLCYLSALTLAGGTLTAPEVNDTLADANSVDWTITEVSEIAPAGLSIVYELTIRGAA